MNQDKLLPCPFCGDTEEVGTRYDDKAWRVHCGACGGCAYGWESEGQAIATWNTRAAIEALSVDDRWRNRCEHLLACLDSCDESGGQPSELDPEDLALMNETRLALAEQSGMEKERCKHGIRRPWQCDNCDRENPMPKGWKP